MVHIIIFTNMDAAGTYYSVEHSGWIIELCIKGVGIMGLK